MILGLPARHLGVAAAAVPRSSAVEDFFIDHIISRSREAAVPSDARLEPLWRVSMLAQRNPQTGQIWSSVAK